MAKAVRVVEVAKAVRVVEVAKAVRARVGKAVKARVVKAVRVDAGKGKPSALSFSSQTGSGASAAHEQPQKLKAEG